MKLFIANATKHVVNFLYCVPEIERYREQTIPIGSQIQISGDLTRQDIDYIIAQHKIYGLIEASERPAGYAGLCYSIDKPVPASRLHDVMDHNTDVLVERGKNLRQEAAIAVNNGIETTLRETRTGGLTNLEMSVVEQENRFSEEGPSVNEGVRVTRQTDDEGPRAPRSKRKAA